MEEPVNQRAQDHEQQADAHRDEAHGRVDVDVGRETCGSICHGLLTAAVFDAGQPSQQSCSVIRPGNAQEPSVGWGNDMEMLRKMFRALLESAEYQDYMASEERGFRHDRESLIRMFRKEMITFELFQDTLEEQSIFWNDDLDLCASMAIKTIKSIRESDDDVDLLPLWREDDDDRAFMEVLFNNTLGQAAENDALITAAAENWDLDRIALIDRILLRMALTEAKSFPTVPVKVTLNEYIELSKYYSTEKSHGFITGLLDPLFQQLKESGAIRKTGRGLLE